MNTLRRLLTPKSFNAATSRHSKAAASAPKQQDADAFKQMIHAQNSSFLGVSAKNPLLRGDHYVRETGDHRLLEGTTKTNSGQVELASTAKAVKAAKREVKDIYQLRQELATEYETRQLRKIRKDFEKILAHIRHLVEQTRQNRRERHRRMNFEHIRHQLSQEYGRVIMQLRTRHFLTASTHELVEMIYVGSFMKVNSGHLVNCGVQMLLNKIQDLTPNQLATVIKSICDIKDGGLADDQKTRLVVAFFGEVVRYPERMLAQMSVKNAIMLVKLGQEGTVGHRIVPEGMSREFLRQLLVVYGSSVEAPAPPSGGEDKKVGDESKKNAPIPRWSATDVAAVCSAVVHHRMATEDAVNFFVVSAPLCTEYVDLLSPTEISLILLAYGVVRFHDVKLFLTLGQKAGDLGEEMSEDDVGRVIRAFEMTDIGFDSLRNSLESAMRMKNVTRSPLSYH